MNANFKERDGKLYLELQTYNAAEGIALRAVSQHLPFPAFRTVTTVVSGTNYYLDLPAAGTESNNQQFPASTVTKD